MAGLRLQRWQTLLGLTAFVALVFMMLSRLNSNGNAPPRVQRLKPAPPPAVSDELVPGTEEIPLLDPGHPIDELISTAAMKFRQLMSQETDDLASAAAAYRRRRNRHPPPGFDEWFKYAKANNAVLIEDLFDQIYHDIGPFWGISAQKLRASVAGQNFVISIRKGRVSSPKDLRYRMFTWVQMFKKIAKYLPDMDLAFNTMDETRLIIPYKTMAEHMGIARAAGILSQDLDRYTVDDVMTSGLITTQNIVNSYPSRDPMVPKDYNYNWTTEMASPWDLYRELCIPLFTLPVAVSMGDFNPPSEFTKDWPSGSLAGYVTNASFAKDPCLHAELRGLHGTFIEPISTKVSTSLFPIFGGSKLYGASDILIPPPRYWTDEPRFASTGEAGMFSKELDWEQKRTEVLWRGIASGGRNRPETWTHFHRHRFVSMLNGSQVKAMQDGTSWPRNIRLPLEKGSSDIASLMNGELGDWVDRMADASFTGLKFFPDGPDCDFLGPYYSVAPEMNMDQMYESKFLPDIDGNSFSGRYRAFLLSNSLPIKATIYSEWHDSRLFAWKHYVPMDSTYADLYGIMDYFMGYTDGEGKARKRGHDRLAKQIALEGQEWARKVLRREDMLIYIYRLVLEYARVMDEKREVMGYVGDL